MTKMAASALVEPVEFVFQDDKSVRVIIRKNEPWFVAKDVCDVLEIKNCGDACSRLDDDEKDTVGLTDSVQRAHKLSVISEAGLYTLVLGSRKPEAKEFKRWITHEVIPSIRKHGAYVTAPTLDQMLSDPDMMIGLLQKLKEERQIRHEEELKRLKAQEERDEAIRTKAQIGSRREASAMGKLSVVVKENDRLKTEMGLSRKFATIKKVQAATGREFGWQLLKEYSKEHELAIKKVQDVNYASGVNAYSAEAWFACYDIDLCELARNDE